jgi:transcriptional regulator with XRE-family HTH domain
MTVGEHMTAAREKKWMSRQQLSVMSGVPVSSIGQYERDARFPGLVNLLSLSDVLGISIDEYVGHGVEEVTAKKEPIKPDSTSAWIAPSNPEPFKDRVRKILKQRNITVFEFTEDTGIDRGRFFHSKPNKRSRHVYMAIAYYFGMNVEELIAGTDAEFDWYGDCGI